MLQHKLVRVNSKYRSRGTTNNFVMNFSVHDLDKVKAIVVVRASLNRTFTNMYAPINVLLWDDYLLTRHTVTIPEGQYTATQLAAAIGVASSGDLTATYNTTTDRFVFTLVSPGTSANILAISPIAEYIGLTADLVIPALATPTPVQTVPQLQGPDVVQIQSQTISSSHCIDVNDNGSYIPLIACIDFSTTPYKFTGTYEAKTPDEWRLNYLNTSGDRALTAIDFQLRDEHGNFINTDENTHFDCVLAFIY